MGLWSLGDDLVVGVSFAAVMIFDRDLHVRCRCLEMSMVSFVVYRCFGLGKSLKSWFFGVISALCVRFLT